jgi:hypothetical protein
LNILLETRRLILRPVTATDAESMHAIRIEMAKPNNLPTLNDTRIHNTKLFCALFGVKDMQPKLNGEEGCDGFNVSGCSSTSQLLDAKKMRFLLKSTAGDDNVVHLFLPGADLNHP